MSRTASGTVDWRGNPARWWARVTVKDKDGKVRRPWVDLERPDLENTPEDKKVAKRLALKRAKLATKGSFVGVEQAVAPKVTLDDLEEKWLALIDVADMKPATRAAHKSNWRANIKPKLGKHAVAALTVPVLRAWIRELRGEGASASTIRNNSNTLTRFFADVKAEHWAALTSNPMRDEDVRSELPTVESPEPDEIEHWTCEGFETLLGLPTMPDVWFGIYVVAVLTGLRDGELHGLQWKHVQLDADVPHLRVRQQLGTAREGEPLTAGLPKTRYGKRDVPLHVLAHGWLAWWKNEGWASYVERDGVHPKPEADDYVFASAAGEPWRPRSAGYVRKHLEAADLPKDFVTPDGERSPFDFHATRHTFATWLGHNGVDGELVDRLLGQSPRTTRGRHYQAPSLVVLARAIGTIVLTLPKRSGVIDVALLRPPESSSQLSQAGRATKGSHEQVEQKQAVGHPSSGVEQRFRKP